MGTRAVIDYEGKPFLATHWDGYPSSLGVDLVKLKDKSPENVMKVASGHSINSADKVMMKKANKLMVKQFKKPDGTYQLGYDWLKDSNDQFVDDISNYGDWAEWEYNIKDGKVFSRKLDGEWHKKKPYSKWTLLPTTTKARKFEKEVYKQREDDYVKEEVVKSTKNPVYGASQLMRTIASSYSGKIPSFAKNVKEVDETYFPQVSSYKPTLTEGEKEMVKTYLNVPKVNRLVSLGKGWHYESLRHRLASYGIKTKPTAFRYSKQFLKQRY